MPTPHSLTLDGLSLSRDTLDELLRVDVNDWSEEDQAVGQFFRKFDSRLPAALREEHKALGERLSGSSVATR